MKPRSSSSSSSSSSVAKDGSGRGISRKIKGSGDSCREAIKFILGNLLYISLVIELCLCNYGDESNSRNDVIYSNQTNNKLQQYEDPIISSLSQPSLSSSSPITSMQTPEHRKQNDRIFTNRFAVRIRPHSDPDAVARQLGYTNMGRIGSLDDYYLFIGHHVSKRSIEPHETKHFDDHEHIEWSEQQHVKRRVKRDVLDLPSISPALTAPKILKFSDPLYDKQWYFNRGAHGGYDMNVAAVWKMGITGKNVVLTILDDGVQADHPDLIRNYDKRASYDINGGDDNPTPQDNGENKHGTRCAGEIAAEAGNEYCGVGVAYNASIGGVRMLDGTVTDDVEAQALGLNPNHIDVYSASWGPDDNGKTVDGPGHLAAQAFVNGVRNGRKGRGSIFVWASGNGGKKQDNCNCDGYTNSIYTLSISSATQRGQKPWYLEECSSTLATTYSSGTPTKDENIVTADQSNEYADAIKEGRKPNPAKFCTQVHTGTSASAPIAAGIVALALEANPELTWRDMQHIVVQTSRYEPLRRESGWIQNAIGRYVSHKFGYGLMDAEAIVKTALRWKQTPPQVICRTTVDNKERLIQEDLVVTMNTSACAGTDNAVNYLEHVQARISLKFQPRGNLRITLISPSGTPSHLLMSRPRDSDEDTFDKWPFMTVHFWGEKPQGTWKIVIRNENRRRIADQQGTLYSWSLVFYGTSAPPQDGVGHLNNISQAGRILPRRTYDQSTFNNKDDVVNGDMGFASSSDNFAVDYKTKYSSSNESPNINNKLRGGVSPDWVPRWMVPIGVVMSIFVITILVFATVVSLIRTGSRIAGNIELKFRSTNNNRSASMKSSNSSAVYTKLQDSDISLDC